MQSVLGVDWISMRRNSSWITTLGYWCAGRTWVDTQILYHYGNLVPPPESCITTGILYHDGRTSWSINNVEPTYMYF